LLETGVDCFVRRSPHHDAKEPGDLTRLPGSFAVHRT